jgi:hypothetical protein
MSESSVSSRSFVSSGGSYFVYFGLLFTTTLLWILSFPESNQQSMVTFTQQSTPHKAGYRILVSVISTWPGRPLEMIYRCLDVFEKVFPSVGHEVHLCFDTNSEELSGILSARPPTQSTREIRVWSLEALGGDPLYLPHVHRKYWEDHETEYDFFIFIEDDILFSIESFNFYVEHRKALQEKGWSFGSILIETWGIDNETLVAIGQVESRANLAVFETSDGIYWAEPWIPYSAYYLLDRDELRRMIEDLNNVWIAGFPAFDKRAINNNLYTGTEVISVGYQYKYSGNQLSSPYGSRGWQSRALVPISQDCVVRQPEGIARHMPSKYAKNTKLAKENDCVQGLGHLSTIECKLGIMPLSRVFLCGDVRPIPLPQWPEGAKLN